MIVTLLDMVKLAYYCFKGTNRRHLNSWILVFSLKMSSSITRHYVFRGSISIGAHHSSWHVGLITLWTSFCKPKIRKLGCIILWIFKIVARLGQILSVFFWIFQHVCKKLITRRNIYKISLNRVQQDIWCLKITVDNRPFCIMKES